MKAIVLTEPELEFGVGTHIDIRFGLMQYGPLDFESLSAPKQIKMGIIGTNETIEGISLWFDHCRHGIAAKQSRQPNLFPRFPGFDLGVNFRSVLVTDARLQRIIPQSAFDQLKKQPDLNHIILEAVDLFLAEVRYLVQNTSVDVIVCAVPMGLYNLMEDFWTSADQANDDSDNDNGIQAVYDFHDMLKARCMPFRKPIQVILPPTYDESKRRQQKTRPERIQRLQDEATRAWNIHTALYYKAGGIPWRLIRPAGEYATCYVGISFYRTLDQTRVHTSIAQVFNERGDGVVVRGSEVRTTKDDRQPHMDEQAAYELLRDALERYREEHRTPPARIVVHKSSKHSTPEIEGFTRAAQDQRIDYIDLVSLYSASTRVLRTGVYPTLRGTLIHLDNYEHVLYTKGSVDFFATYPGLYVPRAQGFRLDRTESTPLFLAQEILGLSKMNWNNTQFDGGKPITKRAAEQVSAILKYIPEGELIAPRYSFYM